MRKVLALLLSLVAAPVGAQQAATASNATLASIARQGYDDTAARFFFSGTHWGLLQLTALNTPLTSTASPVSESGPLVAGHFWAIASSIQVAYSWWKASGSADAQARLTAEWAYLKASIPLSAITCGAVTNTFAHDSDDAAWSASAFIDLYEATSDPVALTYAKALLDCGWTRWQDANLGGGLWYSDNFQNKSVYQGQYALASMLYYLDSSNSTYLTRAEAIDTWAASALQRNGQIVSSGQFTTVIVGGTISNGETVAEQISGGFASSPVTVTYTINGTDTAATTAAGLAALVNGLGISGITSTAPGPTQSIFSPASVTLSVVPTLTPSTGGPTATVATGVLTAASYTYPNDGLYWQDTQPNGSGATYGVPQNAFQPTQIQLASSVVMLEGNMAFSVLDALLYAQTGNPSYLTRINAAAAGIAQREVVAGNVLLDDRDANIDGFAAYLYAADVLPLLTASPAIRISPATFAATAYSCAANARASDGGGYGGDWQGPLEGVWYNRGNGSTEFYITVAAQCPMLAIAAYASNSH